MNLHNINTIAGYEVKLLRRSWLFRIFAFLALLGITATVLWFLTPVFNPLVKQWAERAVASQIPFYSTAFYSIAQSVIVIFLAGSFLKRDKKLDTAEVIYVRPMSNADYIIGKTWGIVRTFFFLNVITLSITAFLHILVAKAPFAIFPYLFYLFTVSLPSLLFVLGLSFMVMSIVKNQAVTFIIMLGVMAVEFFYVKDACYGVFDFFGTHIPALFSDVTGHGNIQMFLLQRFVFLMAGIGFISFTIAFVKRLPHKQWKLVIVHSVGAAGIGIALAAGGLYTLHFNRKMELRNEYIATYNRYADARRVNITDHALTVTPDGEHLEGESRLVLVNRQDEPIEQIILYLNPTLEVDAIECKGTPVSFRREQQVIVVDKALQGKESAELTIRFSGGIDETICYTDVLEKDYLNNTDRQHTFPIGKRYVWLEKRFTLLTPECLWYPVAIPPVNPAAPYNLQKDFTRYSLTVNHDGRQTVLSQGESGREGNSTTFTNSHALPCISLTMADYERKSITVDSTEYEIYCFKGHDYFSEHFTALQDTLPGIIRELKNDIETEQGRNYPFRRFVMAETPAQHHAYIRNWKGYTEYIMPEIAFIPERGIAINSDFQAEKVQRERWRRRDQGIPGPVEMATSIFQYFVRRTFFEENVQYNWDWENQVANKFVAHAMLYHHTGFIRTDKYPILDIALNTMQSQSNKQRNFFWGSLIDDKQRANLYLETHSFRKAISDLELKPEIFYELLKLKSNALGNYINTRISQEKFNAFLKDFYQENLFKTVSFDRFQEKFLEKTGIDLTDFLHRWYEEDHSPTVFVKEVDADQIVVKEVTKYRIRFKAYNPSDVDALVTADIRQGGDFRGGPGGGGRGFGGNPNNNITENYLLPAGSAKEMKIIVDERPASISINTNISHNLPTLHRFNFPKIEQNTQDTVAGVFAIDPRVFSPDPKEFVIDNEDSGFRAIASNNKHKLKDLFMKEDGEKYKNFIPWWAPSRWTTIATDYCYGNVVQSALYKSKGSGNNSVVWSAEITHDGYYEISVWNPKMNRMGPSRQHNNEERNQTYTVSYGGEEESITLNLQQEDPGWMSLGNFYLPKGTTTVTLTDKVSGRYVIADAVKFTSTR